jgi:hypothetical protein
MYLVAPAYVEMFQAAGFAIPESRIPPDSLIDSLFVWGTAPQIADRLRAIRQAGVDELMVTLHPAADPEKELAEAFHTLGGLCRDLRSSAPRNNAH